MTSLPAFQRADRVDLWNDGPAAMVLGICLILLLTTIFYFPALFLHRTLANGDISIIDLPFFEYFAQVVSGKASPLWSTEMWGGHPLFAEGQFGFAHPLNIIWAAIATRLLGSIYAMNLFYWLLKAASGLGVLGLCRSLGASIWASTFAAIAVAFCPIWANQEYALPLFHAMSWVPWVLWSMETWLKQVSLRSAVVFGITLSLLALSGYSQVLYGLVIYASVTLVVALLQARTRREWAKTWRKRAALAVVVAAVAAGLAAVQLIPQIELIGQSHRSYGIGMPFAGLTPLKNYVRGFLVSDYTHSAGIGSVLICALASAAMLLAVPGRVKAHLVAAIILIILGWERATPIFSFLYDHHLVPGLNYFRHTDMFTAIGCVGIAVAAAFTLDRLPGALALPWRAGSGNRMVANQYRRYAGFTALAVFWILVVLTLRISWLSATHVVVATAAALAAYGLIKNYKPRLVAPTLTLLLAVETLAVRMHPFDFLSTDVFGKPPEVTAIQSAADWRDFKMMTVSLAGLIAFVSPDSPELPFRVRQALAVIAPSTNLRWNLPSMNGNLALALKRRMMVESMLSEEILGKVATPPGRRLIDFLGIRFITAGAELTTAGFRPLYFDRRDQIKTRDDDVQVLDENEAALPRLQLYSHYRAVDSPEAAVDAIKNLQAPELVIEDPGRRASEMPSSDSEPGTNQPGRITVLEATDTEYRIKIATSKPQWLFLADANYPGWVATLDGKDARVFSAQVLGKAVQVPAGTHDVILTFRSKSFRLGLLVSLATLTAAVMGLALAPMLWSLWRRRQKVPSRLAPKGPG
jgi:Bacterial membrane protein YfhO